MELRTQALTALITADPAEKVALVAALQQQSAALSIEPQHQLAEPAGLPGRPTRPALLAATLVPPRSPFTPQGLAALLHAICHIEFNAINLALDAVWRFAGMPPAFYLDWMRVAAEEAQHFSLLQRHLQQMGHHYGDFAPDSETKRLRKERLEKKDEELRALRQRLDIFLAG